MICQRQLRAFWYVDHFPQNYFQNLYMLIIFWINHVDHFLMLIIFYTPSTGTIIIHRCNLKSMLNFILQNYFQNRYKKGMWFTEQSEQWFWCQLGLFFCISKSGQKFFFCEDSDNAIFYKRYFWHYLNKCGCHSQWCDHSRAFVRERDYCSNHVHFSYLEKSQQLCVLSMPELFE